MPKAVVILPTSTYRATDFVKAAESLDIDLVVASEEAPPFDMGDRYVQIDCRDAEKAAETIAALGDTVPIDGIIAADDQGVMVAAHAATMLGLPGNPPEAAAATRDKLAMRRALATAELDQPRFASLEPHESTSEVVADFGVPVVIKPLDRAASQGVIRVDDPAHAPEVASRIRRIVGADATLLVESYVPGPEIAVEGLLASGELTVLAVFDKPDTPDGPYFPETMFVTPSRHPDEILAEARRAAESALAAIGLVSGPVHIEFRLDGERARIIEVAGRSIGGLCSRSLDFGLMGTSLESLILRNAIGSPRDDLRRANVASGVLMIPTPKTGTLAAVHGEEETRLIPGITGIDFTIRPGGSVVAPPEGDRYLGFVYARGDDPGKVESALRKAMSTLEVQLEG